MMTLRLRLVAGLFVGAALAASASCTESVPRSLDPTGSSAIDAGEATASPAWGLDARPVSATCKGTAKPAPPVAPDAHIAFQPLTTKPLQHLVDIVPHGGLLYVVDQSGYVRTIAKDGTVAQVLDMHDEVNLGYDSGLLSIAFHPKFQQNGFVYLAFTTPYPTQPPPAGTVFLSVLARFHSNDGGLTIDRASEKRILVRNQPTVNHHGNKVVFGPDGDLYFACGDGAKFDSPNGQDKYALFGKVLRLDVDNGDPYAIPPTNPYAGGGGAPEVYALGFRNPWRFSFDMPTGDLWLGDVGQDNWEEIDKVVLGGNYGFATKEGFSCFLAATCDSTGLIDPIVVHPHSEADAIIGGVVYRGTKVPELIGKYVYGDAVTGHFWSLSTSAPAPVPVRLEEGLPFVGPSSFSLDEDGEIVLVTPAGGAYRIVPPPAPVADLAPKLSGTGCVDAADPTKPASGLFPYDVNVPQWIDGATAERFLSVPADAPVGLKDHARLSLPPGSVAMRTLRAEGRVLETQFLRRRPDASWVAYTYAWSDDQKDASLATSPVSIRLPSGREHVVAPADCVKCHDSASAPSREDLTLGLEAAQLDRLGVDYGSGRTGNPLTTLDHLGMLSAPIMPGSYEPLPDPNGVVVTAGRRARAYLHANCASCHDGTIADDIDLRYFTALRDTRTCRPGTLPSGGSAILAPGDSEASQLFTSVRTAGAGRMPTVGSSVPDPAAVTLLSEWIRSLQPTDCP
jgi:glucose/arabinose dehydrogenase